MTVRQGPPDLLNYIKDSIFFVYNEVLSSPRIQISSVIAKLFHTLEVVKLELQYKLMRRYRLAKARVYPARDIYSRINQREIIFLNVINIIITSVSNDVYNIYTYMLERL